MQALTDILAKLAREKEEIGALTPGLMTEGREG
jgi:hypothetical protein